ncbi:MAG: hypothetical protein NTX53_14910 [candidate division WOR-3 bacterium]|nr:hypothetical protein [candidate division WOR-3 bacterium]
MMASRKSGAGVSRPKQMALKGGGMMQFVLIGAAVVVVIVVALLLFGRGAKKSTSAPAKTASSDNQGIKKASKPAGGAVHASRVDRADEKAKRREERLKQRQEARAAGGRTSRTSSGGYEQGGTSRSSSADPSQLRAILTDGTGSRFALVGERRFKSGDDIEGRRIIEVSADGIKMEYRQNTYSVKVGPKVY